MTDAERKMLLALADAVRVGARVSIYDGAAADTLSRALHQMHKAKKEIEREMEARRPHPAPLLVEFQSGSATGSAAGLLGKGGVLGSQEPAVQCPSCGRPSRPEQG